MSGSASGSDVDQEGLQLPSAEPDQLSDSHSSYILVPEEVDTPPGEDPTNQAAEEPEDLGPKNFCKFFQTGDCRFGGECFNLHEQDPSFIPPKQKQRKQKKQKEPQPGSRMCPKCEKQNNKMRPVMDVVHRIQWDEKFDPGNIIVGYLDRFDGLIEEKFEYFDWSDVTTVDDWETFCIPKHRVYYFKNNGEIVWDRRIKLDLIFPDKIETCVHWSQPKT